MPLITVEPPLLSGQSATTGRIEQLANKQKDMTDSVYLYKYIFTYMYMIYKYICVYICIYLYIYIYQ
jgi:hypothetical protein